MKRWLLPLGSSCLWFVVAAACGGRDVDPPAHDGGTSADNHWTGPVDAPSPEDLRRKGVAELVHEDCCGSDWVLDEGDIFYRDRDSVQRFTTLTDFPQQTVFSGLGGSPTTFLVHGRGLYIWSADLDEPGQWQVVPKNGNQASSVLIGAPTLAQPWPAYFSDKYLYQVLDGQLVRLAPVFGEKTPPPQVIAPIGRDERWHASDDRLCTGKERGSLACARIRSDGSLEPFETVLSPAPARVGKLRIQDGALWWESEREIHRLDLSTGEDTIRAVVCPPQPDSPEQFSSVIDWWLRPEGIYWSDTTGCLGFTPADGDDLTVLLRTLPFTAFAFDETHVYFDGERDLYRVKLSDLHSAALP